jgi:hypothetical protein
VAVFLVVGLLAPQGAALAGTLQRAPNNLGLVGYWPLDDGSGTNASDHSGNGNNGTLTNAPAWVAGKMGQALSFDGTNRSVITGTSAVLNMNNSVTLSAWFMLTTTAPTFQVLETSTGNSYYQITLGGNKLRSFSTNTTPQSILGNTTLKTGVWYLATFVWNAGTMTLYLNGVQDATPTSYTGTISSGTVGIKIGADYPSSPSYFSNGSIDDVRVYNRALSATDVFNLYKSREASIGSSQPLTALNTPGLVGYWTFDGNKMVQNVTDSSSQHNNGNLVGFVSTSSAEVLGKRGQALSFNGGTQCVTSNSSINFSGSWTIGGWFNWQNIAGKGNERVFGGGSSNIPVFWRTVSQFGLVHGGTVDWLTGWVIPSKQWVYIVVTRSGTTATLYVNGALQAQTTSYNFSPGTSPVSIGCDSTGFPAEYFNGYADDVRIYNKALTAQQVAQLYGADTTLNAAQTKKVTTGLVGLWTFNNLDINWVTGQAIDKSGSGNNGALINLSTTTSPTIGKNGQAMKFDTGKSVDVSGLPSLVTGPSASVCGWAFSTANENFRKIVTWTTDDNAGTDGILLVADNTNSMRAIGMGKSTTDPSTIPLNTWVHWCGVYSGGISFLYRNGALVSQSSSGGSSFSPPAKKFGIGNAGTDTTNYSTSRSWVGTLDEVRLYNRSLSAAEVKQLYNEGK